MFNNKALPPYAKLAELMRLRLKPGSGEKNAEQLNTFIDKALKSNEEEKLIEALDFSKRLITLTGVPGLIQYTMALGKLLAITEDEYNAHSQQAFNALVYLNLAEKLYETTPDAKDQVKKVMNMDQVDWEEKKNRLIDLWVLGDRKEEAINAAQSLLETYQQLSAVKNEGPR